MGVDFEWLKGKVEPLLNIEGAIKAIEPDVYYDPGPWCVTKLIALAYFIDIYTKIISKTPYFKKMRYIDLLSGSGLCKIRETGDIVAGSALIAATLCFRQFDEYILVELKERSSKALEKRMKILTPNVKVINEDCNKVISQIVLNLGKYDHYLAFVDCEGLEVNWSTIKTLLTKQGDIIINFQSRMISRVVGRAKRSIADEKKLNLFYGDDRWKYSRGFDDLLDLYIKKIKEETNRKRVLSLPVKGPRAYRYDLILATRETRGGNPWLKPMEDLSETLNGFSSDFNKKALDILTGRRKTLDDYFKQKQIFEEDFTLVNSCCDV